MSELYTTISIVAFILAGIFFAGAIVVFFAANVRGAYMELRGQNDKEWVKKRQSKAAESAAKTAQKKKLQEISRVDGDGEAVTTLENGEEAGPGVYEPGTDVEDMEDMESTTMAHSTASEAATTVEGLEPVTTMEDSRYAEPVTTLEESPFLEAATSLEDTEDTDTPGDFRITKKEVSINSWELISY